MQETEAIDVLNDIADLQITYQPPAALDPYENNPMVHSDEQVELLCRSIRELGFLVPVLVDQDNTIIAGHGRIMAANKLGLGRVPTIHVSHLTDTQKEAYVIMDNKLAQLAGVDVQILFPNIERLESSGFDIEMLGYNDDELSRIADDYAELSLGAIGDAESNLGDEDDDEAQKPEKSADIHQYQTTVRKFMLDEIVQAVKMCRDMNDLASNGEALHEICTQWRKQNEQ